MSRGKYLSLEEARESGDFKRFCEEHPAEADRERFLKRLLSKRISGISRPWNFPPAPEKGSGRCHFHEVSGSRLWIGGCARSSDPRLRPHQGTNASRGGAKCHGSL